MNWEVTNEGREMVGVVGGDGWDFCLFWKGTNSCRGDGRDGYGMGRGLGRYVCMYSVEPVELL